MTIQAIKPGTKPNKENGTPDKRRRVTPATARFPSRGIQTIKNN
jgi:hypothetical protein